MQPLSLIKPMVWLALVGSTSALAGCVYDSDPPRRLTTRPDRTSASAPPASQGGGTTAPRDPSIVGPMLVEVDTDQTMMAEGGDGVGVFVEYAKGGHWHVSWTCDTNQTAQSCDFVVRVTSASSDLSGLDTSELTHDSATSTPRSIEAKTTTSTQTEGVRFVTEPGAVITLEASIGGLKDGAFLFFVQDGKVNGGFTGKLTNPLQLRGNTP